MVAEIVELPKEKKSKVNLKKPSATIAIAGDLSKVQRQFYNAFLYVAKKSLEKNIERRKFAVSLPGLRKFFGVKTRNYDRLKGSIKGLMRTIVEYNYFNKEKNVIFDRMATLLSEVRIVMKGDGKDGIIEFILPDMVRESLIREDIVYANIDLLIIRALKSKYAIALYELCKDYEKVEVPEMTMEEFRHLFGIEDKYKKIQHLKERVLNPACEEINRNPKIPFIVEYELIRRGVMNEYTHIKFHIRPKPAELEDKEAENVKDLETKVKENDEIKDLLAMIPATYRRKKKVVSLVLGGVETKSVEYIKAQIDYVLNKFKKGKVENFEAYLKQAIENDYAGFEEVDDIGFITVDDAIGFRGYITKNGKEHYVEITVVEPKENNSDELIGRDREREYLVRLDEVETGELFNWYEMSEKKLLEYAKRNVERRKKIREQ